MAEDQWKTPGGWHATRERWKPNEVWRETRDGMGEAQGPPDNPNNYGHRTGSWRARFNDWLADKLYGS